MTYFLEGRCELDLRVKSIRIFRNDAIRNDGGIKLETGVKPQAILSPRPYEILHEIHPSSRFEPLIVNIDVFAFDYDVSVESCITDKG